MGFNSAFKGLTYYCGFCVIHIWNCLIRLVTAWLTEELGFVPCRGRIRFISFTNSDPTRLVPSRVTFPFMGGKAATAGSSPCSCAFLTYFSADFHCGDIFYA